MPHPLYNDDFKFTRLVTPTTTGAFKRTFEESGVYYFETEARNQEQKHVCVVEVITSHREHVVEIFDNKFSPGRITIEEGDQVWFSWSKDKVRFISLYNSKSWFVLTMQWTVPYSNKTVFTKYTSDSRCESVPAFFAANLCPRTSVFIIS
jgi:plastocyanin